ncbi:hypothetical protein [Verrucosispora sp. TAA-831]|uniref:hypothetical protein n=1 Tax=Verrucosispora sp. TAA-831 TaxID=3422227 RepID=UPI003D6E43CD
MPHTRACPVDCACHTGPYTPCDVTGGCGSHGCQPAPTGTCPACQKRDPEYGSVCEPCRRWLPVALASIPELAARLADELIPADDSHDTHVLVCRTCGLSVPPDAARHPGRPEFDHSPSGQWHGGWLPRRIIRRAAGPAPAIAPDAIVTGGGAEPGTPINLHLHDLLGDVVRDGGRAIDITGDNWIPASNLTPVAVNHDRFEVTYHREEHADGTVTAHREHRHIRQRVTVTDRRQRRDTNGHKVMVPAGDQIGALPIAVVLDQEVRAWIDADAPGSRYRPNPTIPDLVQWLARRLDWACDHYPGMDAFVVMLRQVRGQAMAALGEFDPEAELCDGVECDRCHLRMLYRRQDGTGDVECHNPDCRRVMRAAEYRDHLREIAPQARQKRPRNRV